MKIDIALLVTPRLTTTAQQNLKKASYGHLGTHFDVMNKVFPLEYTEREGIVFGISDQGKGETGVNDIDLSLVKEGMFVAFCSGFIEQEGYGTANYFHDHPSLSFELINALLDISVPRETGEMKGVD